MVPGHVRLWHWATGCGACLLPLEALELGGPWRVCVWGGSRLWRQQVWKVQVPPAPPPTHSWAFG